MSKQPFGIDSQLDGGRCRLFVSGELDLATVPELEQAVEAALTDGARELVIDLTRIAFVDSSALRMFIVLSDRGQREGFKLGLVRPPDRALSVFRVSGAEENLPFIDGAD
jgi:anti-sigma B factor antagonist